MRRIRHLLLRSIALVLTTACASSAPVPPQPSDRIVLIQENGDILRQSTLDENSRATFNAPFRRVWNALIASYDELGIQPTVVDPSSGRYGNAGFVVPKEILGRPRRDYFSCGSGLTGPLVDQGRVTADVQTTLTSTNDGKTAATTHVGGQLRRNEGTSGNPVACASTGLLEEMIRVRTEKRLAGGS